MSKTLHQVISTHEPEESLAHAQMDDLLYGTLPRHRWPNLMVTVQAFRKEASAERQRNWPPPRWESCSCPTEASLDGFRAYLEDYLHPRLMVLALSAMYRSDPGHDFGFILRDARRLIDELAFTITEIASLSRPEIPHLCTLDQSLNGLRKAWREMCGAEWPNTSLPALQRDEDSIVTKEKPIDTRSLKPKRSTSRGDGREKLIAALTLHHKYSNGSCLDLTPIGNNQLARLAKVSPSTASAFFNARLGGLKAYMRMRYDKSITTFLKMLNNEFTPKHPFENIPANKSRRKQVDDVD